MRQLLFISALSIIVAIYVSSCSQVQGTQAAPPPQALPVLAIHASPATTYTEYSATVEGKTNVEIRPQVSGYLDKIFVEEGAYVMQGQPLFKINDRPYDEQLNNAEANISAAKANMDKAAIEVNRLKPLVENKVISDVQLKSRRSRVCRCQSRGQPDGGSLQQCAYQSRLYAGQSTREWIYR